MRLIIFKLDNDFQCKTINRKTIKLSFVKNQCLSY